jgi:hypothetical protein
MNDGDENQEVQLHKAIEENEAAMGHMRNLIDGYKFRLEEREARNPIGARLARGAKRNRRSRTLPQR